MFISTHPSKVLHLSSPLASSLDVLFHCEQKCFES
ncbi:hypothetical protein CapIbe_016589, partial [Capra ibex]